MNNQISHRIDELRKQMKAAGTDAVIIPQTDPHQSEYISSHWQVRRYLSGFTGSAGSLVVTANKALLWTDSRYFLQAANQLEGTGIELMRDGLPDTPSIETWLTDNLKRGQCVGVDGMLFSKNEAERLEKYFTLHGLRFKTDFDVVDEIWPDRPALPADEVFVHEEKFAGQSAKSKIAGILDKVRHQFADSVFISPLDEIAWVLNIRSRDVKYNPVATAYLYVAPEGTTLLIDPVKVTPAMKDYLKSQGVNVQPYANVKSFISALPTDAHVLIEPNKTSVTLANLLGSRAVTGETVVAIDKACKNDIQIAGLREAMEHDGVAMVCSLMELEKRIAEGVPTTELDVAAILLKYRSQQPLFFDESFGTIAGYGPHGAIVHYEADEQSSSTLRPEGLLLIDSGAQYLNGTTDLTRTIALGAPTAGEKHDFTLVMKGHIALGTAIFPAGTRGAQLDALAHQFLWKEGLNYLHGTGHGVGFFLNVHEGPQSIRLNYMPTPIMPGMITSNEPGLYRENIHGIRCENLVLCVPAMTTEFGEFLKFETLTLCPFDLSLFETEIMTDAEIDWLNNYHAEVRRRLLPLLNAEQQAWLTEKTKPLSR